MIYDSITANKWRSGVLIVVFIMLVGLVGWAFGRWIGWGPWGLVGALGVASVMAVGSYWYSDKLVLSMSHARPVDKTQEPYLVNTIEGLAIAAGVPVPAAYVIDDPAPNAFATGRDPRHAALAVTTGLLQKLDRLELEGVVAHELSHVKNYDTRVLTLTAVLAGTIALMSDWMLRTWWFVGGDDEGGGGRGGIVGAGIGLVLAIIAPLAALLIQMAVSRQREYLADANGALLTRYPKGLADALRAISDDPEPLRAANKATASLYITNPLKERGKRLDTLFDTHPPVDERIRRLEAM